MWDCNSLNGRTETDLQTSLRLLPPSCNVPTTMHGCLKQKSRFRCKLCWLCCPVTRAKLVHQPLDQLSSSYAGLWGSHSHLTLWAGPPSQKSIPSGPPSADKRKKRASKWCAKNKRSSTRQHMQGKSHHASNGRHSGSALGWNHEFHEIREHAIDHAFHGIYEHAIIVGWKKQE